MICMTLPMPVRTIRRTKAEASPGAVLDTDAWIEAHLATWGRWMRHGVVTKGLPRRSAGLTGFTHTDTESSYNRLDSQIARAVDACLVELTNAERMAVNNRHGLAVYHFLCGNEAELYASAKEKLIPLLRKRDIQ